MNAVALLLAVATVGVDYGWQRAEDGELEYIIQIEPELLETLRDEGVEIVSRIHPQARDIKRLRIRVGNSQLPKEISDLIINNTPGYGASGPPGNRSSTPTQPAFQSGAAGGTVPGAVPPATYGAPPGASRWADGTAGAPGGSSAGVPGGAFSAGANSPMTAPTGTSAGVPVGASAGSGRFVPPDPTYSNPPAQPAQVPAVPSGTATSPAAGNFAGAAPGAVPGSAPAAVPYDTSQPPAVPSGLGGQNPAGSIGSDSRYVPSGADPREEVRIPDNSMGRWSSQPDQPSAGSWNTGQGGSGSAASPASSSRLGTVFGNQPANQPGSPADRYGAPAGQYGTAAGQYGTPASQNGTSAGQYGTPTGQYGTAGQSGAVAGQPATPNDQYGTAAGQYGIAAGQYGTPAGQFGTSTGQYGAPTSQPYGSSAGPTGGVAGQSGITVGPNGPSYGSVPQPGQAGFNNQQPATGQGSFFPVPDYGGYAPRTADNAGALPGYGREPISGTGTTYPSLQPPLQNGGYPPYDGVAGQASGAGRFGPEAPPRVPVGAAGGANDPSSGWTHAGGSGSNASLWPPPPITPASTNERPGSLAGQPTEVAKAPTAAGSAADDSSAAPPAASLPDDLERPWVPLTLTVFGLLLSLGANAYLAWIALGLHGRYRDLVYEMRRAEAVAT
ncbi:MAG: hypothetical protein J5I93_21970 [Pirellulaceae bacterium]|nr:hypothetical protein [Pirellulaceae bacterium]